MICTDPPVIMAVSAPMCQGDNQMFAGTAPFLWDFTQIFSNFALIAYNLDFDLVGNCIGDGSLLSQWLLLYCSIVLFCSSPIQ